MLSYWTYSLRRRPYVVAALSLSILVLGLLLYPALRTRLESAYTESQNIDEATALAVAKKVIGARVLDALPFRHRGDERQYIAVLVEEDSGSYYYHGPGFKVAPAKLVIITSLGGTFQTDPMTMVAFDKFFSAQEKREEEEEGDPREEKQRYLRSIYGVLDIDGDGQKEVYTINRDGDMDAYGSDIAVYAPSRAGLYRLGSSGPYRAELLATTASKNLIDQPEIDIWLRQVASQLILPDDYEVKSAERVSLKEAARQWVQRHGTGFTKGVLQGDIYPGEIPPSGAAVICLVEDDQYVWKSFFKGPVFAYDKQRNAHFVVFVPPTSADWVNQMVSGQKYLWLSRRVERGILVLNKEAHALEVIDIPELTAAAAEESLADPQVHNLVFSLQGESLRLESIAGSTPVTLPDKIASDEFQNATGCQTEEPMAVQTATSSEESGALQEESLPTPKSDTTKQVSPPSQKPQPKLGTYRVAHPTQLLQSPQADAAVIARLRPGTRVNVTQHVANGWARIESKKPGRAPGYLQWKDLKPIRKR